MIEDLLQAHPAADPSETAPLAIAPRLRLAIVTCMDARINLQAVLGIREGDAHVIRNAGGVITDDVLASLEMSQTIGTQSVMIIHHTDCGANKNTDETIAAQVERNTGVRPAPGRYRTFTHSDTELRRSIALLRAHPLLQHRHDIRGFVLDLGTRKLREVAAQQHVA